MPYRQFSSSLLLFVLLLGGGGYATLQPLQNAAVDASSLTIHDGLQQHVAAPPREETEWENRPFAPREYVRIIKPPR